MAEVTIEVIQKTEIRASSSPNTTDHLFTILAGLKHGIFNNPDYINIALLVEGIFLFSWFWVVMCFHSML